MDEETKKILVENNEMLKKLVFFQKLNQIYRVVYWSIIILSAIGAFYYLKPLLGGLINVYTGGVGTSNISNIGDIGKSLGDKSQIEDFVKSFHLLMTG